MNEPIDLAALRYDDEHCCDCGSCSVCYWQGLAHAAADAIEQKDAALRRLLEQPWSSISHEQGRAALALTREKKGGA